LSATKPFPSASKTHLVAGWRPWLAQIIWHSWMTAWQMLPICTLTEGSGTDSYLNIWTPPREPQTNISPLSADNERHEIKTIWTQIQKRDGLYMLNTTKSWIWIFDKLTNCSDDIFITWTLSPETTHNEFRFMAAIEKTAPPRLSQTKEIGELPNVKNNWENCNNAILTLEIHHRFWNRQASLGYFLIAGSRADVHDLRTTLKKCLKLMSRYTEFYNDIQHPRCTKTALILWDPMNLERTQHQSDD
jgi:hypothetical protein